MSFWDIFNKRKQENYPVPNGYRTSDSENEHYSKKYDNIYNPVLFSMTYDRDYICGDRQSVMTKDWVVPEWWYLSTQYLNKINKESKDLNSDKIKNPKRFFETMESLEKSLSEYNNYKFKNFYINMEMDLYNMKKTDMINRFIDRSFKDEFRRALELKTANGRVDRIEHWFMVMKYYSQYMTPESKQKFSDLYVQWLSEFRAIAEKEQL